MDHAATMRRMYDLLSAGDIDGFGDLIAEDFVEHEEAPGLQPSKEGVKQLFRMPIHAFSRERHARASSIHTTVGKRACLCEKRRASRFTRMFHTPIKGDVAIHFCSRARPRAGTRARTSARAATLDGDRL